MVEPGGYCENCQFIWPTYKASRSISISESSTTIGTSTLIHLKAPQAITSSHKLFSLQTYSKSIPSKLQLTMHPSTIFAFLASVAMVTAAPNYTTTPQASPTPPPPPPSNGNQCGQNQVQSCCNSENDVAVLGLECALLSLCKSYIT